MGEEPLARLRVCYEHGKSMMLCRVRMTFFRNDSTVFGGLIHGLTNRAKSKANATTLPQRRKTRGGSKRCSHCLGNGSMNGRRKDTFQAERSSPATIQISQYENVLGLTGIISSH